MIARLKDHLSSEFPFLKNSKLLLAVSGGIDSMVLVHLFQRLRYDIAIAHCNFQLRGDESRADSEFVKEYASKYDIPFYEANFDTLQYATENKLSLQVAARELRYEWFYELLDKENKDYILTAHHADDAIETFVINLIRGSGIDGFVGIPTQNKNVIRPLLTWTRDEILAYANKENCQWREDSSNLSDKYLRNKIRNNIIPFFKASNTNFLESFQNTQDHLKESQQIMMDAVDFKFRLVTHEEDGNILFEISKLKEITSLKGYLYYWLRPYKFSAWDDIYDLIHFGQTGKLIQSKTHQLLKNRGFLILSEKTLEIEESHFTIGSFDEKVNFPINLSLCQLDDIHESNTNTIFVDAELLKFPLTIRRWEEGDVFHPFGMQGNSKKISKYFKDEKLSLIEKAGVWLLCSENQIVWVIGYRLDDRFKVTEFTNEIIHIQYLK